MTHVQNDRVIRALFGEAVDRTPIWLMRQAGRYLPEYRAVRAKAGNFMAMCQNPDIACEITMQPLERFDLDAGIIFSDILTIPDALGLGLYFAEGEGPKFERPVRDEAAIAALSTVDVSDLNYVHDAIRLTKKAINGRVPLFGFAGSPWTVATYMVEGGSSKNYSVIKSMMYKNPELLHQLLKVLTNSTIAYLNMQIEAGADCLMLFDTWGGVLSPSYYQQFSLHYMNEIAKDLKRKNAPLVFFTKGGGVFFNALADADCDALGVDWTFDMATAKKIVGNKKALQGNLDPGVLYAPEAVIEQEAKRILNAFPDKKGHVFNLGHGIWPDIDPEKVQFLIDVVHG